MCVLFDTIFQQRQQLWRRLRRRRQWRRCQATNGTTVGYSAGNAVQIYLLCLEICIIFQHNILFAYVWESHSVCAAHCGVFALVVTVNLTLESFRFNSTYFLILSLELFAAIGSRLGSLALLHFFLVVNSCVLRFRKRFQGIRDALGWNSMKWMAAGTMSWILNKALVNGARV